MNRGLNATLGYRRGVQNTVLMFTNYFSGEPGIARDDIGGQQTSGLPSGYPISRDFNIHVINRH
jgi:hypothetical protein